MTTLKTLLMGAAVATLPMAAVAQNAMDAQISQIDVSADFSATAGANAAEYYPTLETDLESALAQTLEPYMNSSGRQLNVLISELSVDGNPVLSGQNANRLSGTLFVEDQQNVSGSADDDGNVPATVPITILAVVDASAATNAAAASAGPVFIVQPTGDDMYAALVGGFATVAAERIDEVMLPSGG